jgi:hypothetical protein
MWRMDSLSVGISILCSGGKGPSYLGCRLSVVSASLSPSMSITIAENSDHDPLETVITMLWN